jgi:hypothetical protein
MRDIEAIDSEPASCMRRPRRSPSSPHGSATRTQLHHAHLRPRPERRTKDSRGHIEEGCDTRVTPKYLRTPSAHLHGSSRSWGRYRAEPPVRIELFSAVLVRGRNTVPPAERHHCDSSGFAGFVAIVWPKCGHALTPAH